MSTERELSDGLSPALSRAARSGASRSEWISPELIERTRRVWQPYYAEPITDEIAVTILRNAGLLIDAVVISEIPQARRGPKP